jgi:hypothetical protein
MGGACCTYWGQERCIQDFLGEDLMERNHLEDIGVNRMIILKCIFKKWNGEACTGLIWLKIGTGGGLL